MESGPRRFAWRLDRALTLERIERWATPLVLAALLVYAALTLYLTRGVSFSGDELGYFGHSEGYSPGAIFRPHNGHAIAVTRLIYETSLNLFGTTYLPIRVVMIAGVALAAWLLFVYLSRRVGKGAALAVLLVVIFAGANPVLTQGNVMMFAQATAAGIGALLVLDRRDRLGDVAGCALLLISTFSIEFGFGFALGVTLWFLAAGQWRRAWVGLVPILAYGVWFLWALQFDQGVGSAINLLLAPNYAADSLAASLGSFFGLGGGLVGNPVAPYLDWGRVLAAVAVVLLVHRMVRHRPGPAILVPVGILIVLWVGGSFAFGIQRSPVEPRYLVAVQVAMLLLAAEAYRAWKPTRNAVLALLAVALLALPVNLYLLRARGNSIRKISAVAQGQLVALELYPEQASLQQPLTRAYVEGVRRWGSPTYPAATLPGRDPAARAKADEVLGILITPSLAPLSGDVRGGCTPGPGGEVELPPGGAVLASESGGPVTLRRFADQPSIDAGTLQPGRPAALALPTDASPQPWKATIGGDPAIRICPLPAPGEQPTP